VYNYACPHLKRKFSGAGMCSFQGTGMRYATKREYLCRGKRWEGRRGHALSDKARISLPREELKGKERACAKRQKQEYLLSLICRPKATKNHYTDYR